MIHAHHNYGGNIPRQRIQVVVAVVVVGSMRHAEKRRGERREERKRERKKVRIQLLLPKTIHTNPGCPPYGLKKPGWGAPHPP